VSKDSISTAVDVGVEDDEDDGDGDGDGNTDAAAALVELDASDLCSSLFCWLLNLLHMGHDPLRSIASSSIRLNRCISLSHASNARRPPGLDQ